MTIESEASEAGGYIRKFLTAISTIFFKSRPELRQTQMICLGLLNWVRCKGAPGSASEPVIDPSPRTLRKPRTRRSFITMGIKATITEVVQGVQSS